MNKTQKPQIIQHSFPLPSPQSSQFPSKLSPLNSVPSPPHAYIPSINMISQSKPK